MWKRIDEMKQMIWGYYLWYMYRLRDFGVVIFGKNKVLQLQNENQWKRDRSIENKASIMAKFNVFGSPMGISQKIYSNSAFSNTFLLIYVEFFFILQVFKNLYLCVSLFIIDNFAENYRMQLLDKLNKSKKSPNVD